MPNTYKVNQNYFKTIDTEDKAYWLGFIYADGYLNKKQNTFGIELKSTDMEHLEKFGKCIESDRPIKIYNKNSTYGPQTNCRWVCSNKTLYSDLIKHGITTTKSYDGKFPFVDDEQYIKDVVRGIFDGDGCITYRKGTIGYLTGSIGVCGTKEVLEYIENFSGFKWAWFQRYPKKDVNNFQISCGNQNNIVAFLDSIYKDANIYLDRKYKKYQEYVGSRNFIEQEGINRHNYNTISKSNKSGTPGVRWCENSKKWNAMITVDGKPMNLGYFINLSDAVQIRKEAEEKYLSSFWRNGGNKIEL